MKLKVTRRSLLQAAGVGVGAGAVGSTVPFLNDSINRGKFVASDLEVLTVTPTSVVISWTTRTPGYSVGRIPEPIPTTTRVMLGPVDGPLKVVYEDEALTASHFVEISGLEPGRQYRFEAWSSDKRAKPGLVTTSKGDRPERSGVFTTLLPPKGKYLGTIALSNDPHIGEASQGGMIGNFPPPIEQEPNQPHHTEVMFLGMMEQLKTFGSPFLMVAGDVTESSLPQEARDARRMLDSYGQMGSDWMVVRGNHDRPRKGKKYSSASEVLGHPKYFDPFGDQFLPWRQLQSYTLPSGLRIVGLDTTMRDLSGGDIDDKQFDLFASVLRSDPDRPTIVVNHHPVTKDSALSNPGGPIFVTNPRDGLRIQKEEGLARGVFLHYSGHNHRMKTSRGDFERSNTNYLENAAVTSYPGGFTLLHLYTGGYQVNFRRVSTPLGLRWCFRSRWTTFGLLPEMTLGQLADRNHVRECDLSGLKPFSTGWTPESTFG